MKMLVAATLTIIVLSQNPAKPPENKSSAKGKSAQFITQSDSGQNQNQTIPQTPPPKSIFNQNQVEEQNAAPKDANNTPELEGKVVKFTGFLVVVGFLQFVALIGQVLIYYRQSQIMAQQVKEMEGQRITMLGQLETMRGQLTQMESSAKQTDKLIEHASEQVKAAEGQVRQMEASGKHTEGLALQAVRQSDLTQKELELGYRPWIAVDVAPSSSISFDERGCVLMLNVTMTNVGHSVARHVSLWVDFAILGVDDPMKVQARLSAIMKQPQNENSDYGWLLFPSQKTVEQRPVIAQPENVQKAMDMKTFQGLNAIGFHLVGCVDYPSALDPSKRHQTRFEFIVGYGDAAKGTVMCAFDPSVKSYQNVVLIPTMHGASAD